MAKRKVSAADKTVIHSIKHDEIPWTRDQLNVIINEPHEYSAQVVKAAKEQLRKQSKPETTEQTIRRLGFGI